MRWRSGHAVVLLGVVLLLLLVPYPEPGRIAEALLDMGHVPLGMIVALIAFAFLRSRLAAGALAVVFLAGIEVVQPLFGRSRSLGDLVAGALGAAAAVALLYAWKRPWPARVALGLVAVLLLAAGCVPAGRVVADAMRQREALPMLASFEDDLEMTRWWFDHAKGTRQGAHATRGLWSLRVDLGVAAYPSATLAHPYPDWTGYRALALDLFVEGDEPLALVLKVVDEEHDETYGDRFQVELDLAPGPHVVRVPLEEVRQAPRSRPMDLSRIAAVQLFADHPRAPRTFTVDAIRLER